MKLKIKNGHCELFCDEKLILKFPKGSLAERIYNNLNDKTLRITDEHGFIQPGYYRGTDVSNSRTRVWRIRDAEYLKRVRRDPTMRLLMSIFNPSADSLKLMYRAIQYTFQAEEPLNNDADKAVLMVINRTFPYAVQPQKPLNDNQNEIQTEEPLDDNLLMYYDDIDDTGEVVEKRYDYGDGPDIQIQDLQSLIGYDLQFLKGFKICRRCKKLYRPQKDELYCSNTCRVELSRHRSPWCDAQIQVKKAIDKEKQEIQDQLYREGLQPEERAVLKRTLDTYNAAYNDWMTFSAGGDQSEAAKTYRLWGKKCSSMAFLEDQWERLCRRKKKQ